MPAKKKQSWLEKNWPFRHTETRLNADTNLIKLVAMITMLIDHLGAAVFPQYRILRVIGRVAFPIYAYCIAVGCAYTRNIGRYLERLAILALISQPIYVLALHHTNSLMYACSFAQAPLRAAFSFYVYSWKDPSILLTLMVGVGAIWALRERKLFTLLLVLLLTYLLKDSLDYGLKGVFLNVRFFGAHLVADRFKAGNAFFILDFHFALPPKVICHITFACQRQSCGSFRAARVLSK